MTMTTPVVTDSVAWAMWRQAPCTADSRVSARISASNSGRMGSASRVIRRCSGKSPEPSLSFGIGLRQPVRDALDRGRGRIVEGREVVAVDVDLSRAGFVRANQDDSP